MRIYMSCSASPSVKGEYKELASRIATLLCCEKHKLIFTGSDEGMMGSSYMTFKYEEGKVKAIVFAKEIDFLNNIEVDAYEVAPNTFKQHELLYEKSDAILILPGGIETLADLFSMLEEKEKSMHKKGIILYNDKNFFTPLLEMIKKLYQENMISAEILHHIKVVENEAGLKRILEQMKKEGIENE